MRRAVVPVDLVSEQKVILGYCSIRQLIYLISGGSIAYNLIGIIVGDGSLLDLYNMVIISIIISIIGGIVFFLGFWKKEEDDMFWDKYLFIKIVYNLNRENKIFRHGSDL
ncbi:PrgI family protein [Brevibacillus halotolerans]|uniref:PrgI family mobile element protein n=1 Tax=Brevibacillus TaxID=55080 RepID=UPI0005587954|nr:MULTISPECIES: PrgI family protein [Brevibacillus]MCR8964175.1 PrgI family protein [Brevibacillus laterosporus]MCZ0836330.1 PrgI family protein [Brevibacillus halotolerans]